MDAKLRQEQALATDIPHAFKNGNKTKEYQTQQASFSPALISPQRPPRSNKSLPTSDVSVCAGFALHTCVSASVNDCVLSLSMCVLPPPTIWVLFGEIFCKNHSHAVVGLPL
ncbi:hypothetical protein GOODEAATRI_009674 [Goodea atripinnis]|uniref:Uncharacterized protein n=2 Tax=Goodeidae TaxID=28758 RepID=A0ABU7BS79_9TELE|nr:hypothetical protein [Ataeniobius toweri]